jgi:SAM-dependent methyltransferase
VTTRVDEKRWRDAQRWELELWTSQQRKFGLRGPLWAAVRRLPARLRPARVSGDDWNEWWAEKFDNYAFLPRDLGDYVELGCGPYTNTRLILKARSARCVVCSDPLAREYVRYRGRWLAEAFRSGRVEVDDHAIEDLPFEAGSFDVVVMINVLDHVKDAIACLETASGLVRAGGWFILGQDLTNDEEDPARATEDIGHPIRLDRRDLQPFLDRFAPVLDRVLPREQGRAPHAHYGTQIFVGRRDEA